MVDVSGTVWDGVQGTAKGYVTAADASQANIGWLTMQVAETASNGSTGSSFDPTALFMEVTGNFDAKVEMPLMPDDADFLTLSLAAWTEDQTNAVHVDNVRSTTNRVRFRDQGVGRPGRLGSYVYGFFLRRSRTSPSRPLSGPGGQGPIEGKASEKGGAAGAGSFSPRRSRRIQP